MEHLGETRVDLSRYEDKRRWGYLAMRALWACVQLPFFPRMPKRLSWLRIALLRLFGAEIGKRCFIAGGTRVWVPKNLRIGDFVAIGEGVKVYNLAPVVIGSNTVISQESHLCTASHDYTDPGFSLYSEPITVGSSVWIAAQVFIAPGITVADGTVIGACSAVTRDLPAWTVCAGNPCRPLKPRVLKKT